MNEFEMILNKLDTLTKEVAELRATLQPTTIVVQDSKIKEEPIYFTEVPQKLKETPFDNLKFLNAIMSSSKSPFKELKTKYGITASDDDLRVHLNRRYGETWKNSILRTIGKEVPEVQIPEMLKNLDRKKVLKSVVDNGYAATEKLVRVRCIEAGGSLKPGTLGAYLEQIIGKPKFNSETWAKFCGEKL